MFYGASQKGDSGEFFLSIYVEVKVCTSGTTKDKKPSPAAQCVHTVLLSSSTSRFRGNILESNKYSFCNKWNMFNTICYIQFDMIKFTPDSFAFYKKNL